VSFKYIFDIKSHNMLILLLLLFCFVVFVFDQHRAQLRNAGKFVEIERKKRVEKEC
jgi:hypothetical protein